MRLERSSGRGRPENPRARRAQQGGAPSGPNAPGASEEGVKVSVCCITYNQAGTIRQCLEAILTQEAPFNFEILVHDDASSDGTSQIIQEFSAANPAKFRTILQELNTYSQGIDPFATLINMASGQYIALCEGDDYWTDALKLATQAELLDRNLDVDICSHECAHLYIGYGEAGEDILDTPAAWTGQRFFTVADVITNVNSQRERFAHTMSLMLRRSAAQRFASFAARSRHLRASDKFIKFFGAERGGGVAIGAVMGVHRVNSAGSWTSQVRSDAAFRIHNTTAKIRALIELRAQASPRSVAFVEQACRIEIVKLALHKDFAPSKRLAYLASTLPRLGAIQAGRAVVAIAGRLIANRVRSLVKAKGSAR